MKKNSHRYLLYGYIETVFNQPYYFSCVCDKHDNQQLKKLFSFEFHFTCRASTWKKSPAKYEATFLSESRSSSERKDQTINTSNSMEEKFTHTEKSEFSSQLLEDWFNCCRNFEGEVRRARFEIYVKKHIFKSIFHSN